MILPIELLKNIFHCKIQDQVLSDYQTFQMRHNKAMQIELIAQMRAITKLLLGIRPYSETIFQRATAEEIERIYAEQERPYATMYLPAIKQKLSRNE